MENYIKEMNDKLHDKGFAPYELIKDGNGLLTAEKILEDSIRLAPEDKGLKVGFVQIINGRIVRFFNLEELVLIKK